MPILNIYTKKVVRIGDKFTFAGNMPVEVSAFSDGNVVLIGPAGFRRSVPFAALGLEAVSTLAPSLLMTDDDWIHATNNAKETGGHFLGYLAKAYQHADSGNQPPIKAAYHTHFFKYLNHVRQQELREDARQS